MKVIETVVRTELMSIKVLKTDKEDDVIADDKFNN